MPTIAEPKLRQIPIRDLVAASNIRQDVDRQGLDEMKASILAHGVLQNLIASPRRSDGRNAVYGGGRRLLAATELMAEGKISADYRLPVLCFDDIDPESPDAIARAMSENMIREQMDYIDECAAMLSLANAGKPEKEIAAIFGFRPRTVRERLLIGQLIPDAHSLVKNRTRTLDWARALTMADKSMQQKICDDITANPTSWATGDEIRSYLTRSTIPATHALFDRDEYTGTIVSDFFEGDKYSDLTAFWELQNAAIEDLRCDLEAEGWKKVTVIHQPLQTWSFEETTDRDEGESFIEVSPNGMVEIHRGLKPVAAEEETTVTLDDDAHSSDVVTETIAPSEVRPTASICEYAAAQRSAMVQVELASNFRKSLEYSVLAMMGHRGASFGVTAYTMPGGSEAQTSEAFQARAAVQARVDDIASQAAAEVDPAARDRALVAMIQSMDDAGLQELFSALTALRAGQQSRRSADDGESSLMNTFGADIDIRAFWTPDQAFFELMSSEDLRRIATAVMPGASVTRFAASKKKDLVRALASVFADAREGGTMSADLIAQFNSWVPGIMSFPGKVRTVDPGSQEALFDGEGDLEDMLFAGE